MPVQPRNAMCSSAWADPGKPGGVSSPPTLKFSSTVTTGASALRTMTTCKPLVSVARVTLLGSAALRRGAQTVSRNSKGSRALNFTFISPMGGFSRVAFFRRPASSLARRGWKKKPQVPPLRCQWGCGQQLLQRHHVHAYLQAVFCAAEQNPANGADVAVVPAPRQGDVPVGRHAVVGRVEIRPTKARAPRRTPGMRCVRAHQARAAGRRKRAQVA